MDFWVDLVLLSRQDISGLYMFKQKVNHASQFCFLASASELFAQNRDASSSVDYTTTVDFTNICLLRRLQDTCSWTYRLIAQS